MQKRNRLKIELLKRWKVKFISLKLYVLITVERFPSNLKNYLGTAVIAFKTQKFY